MVGQISDIKREVVPLGDTMNTAARDRWGLPHDRP
jgi:hypothetical protein